MQIKICSHNIIILTTYKGTFSDPEITVSLTLRGCIYPFFQTVLRAALNAADMTVQNVGRPLLDKNETDRQLFILISCRISSLFK